MKIPALLLAGALILQPLAALPQALPAGDLDQTISAQEPAVTGQKVIDQGHIDIGPRFDNSAEGKGKWLIQIHDSSGSQAVWRNLPDVVLKVSDAAKQTVPDDQSYAFLGEKPGSEVFVVPQTQQQGVVWAGWNTQDPQVMTAIKRQARLSLIGMQGPGTVMMYLQSGDLSQPQVLWDSRKQQRQDIFMDANVHTHANWVFSQPGTYFLTVEFAAELTDGTTASSTQVLRYSVGSSTDTGPAFAAVAAANSISTDSSTAAAAKQDQLPSALLWAGGGVLLALIVVVLLIVLLRSIVSSRRAKAAVEAASVNRAKGSE